MTNIIATFEQGRIYSDNAVTFEVTRKTAKTITYVEIIHYGNYNEKRRGPKRAKLREHEYTEYFLDAGGHAYEAGYRNGETTKTK